MWKLSAVTILALIFPALATTALCDATSHVVTGGVGISVTTPSGITHSREMTRSAGTTQVTGTGAGSFDGSSWIGVSTGMPDGHGASVAHVVTHGVALSVTNPGGTHTQSHVNTKGFAKGTASFDGGSSVSASTGAWPAP